METIIYNQAGKETDKLNLPQAVFALPWNGDLVHQVVVSMLSNKRVPIAHTKDRGAVAGGGVKPWRQKGTGRARHGSIRSPLWRGGGVTFGPTKDRNFSKKINKKMRIKALYTILSQKLKDGEILFVDKFEFPQIKTQDAKGVLKNLSQIKGFQNILTKKKNSAFVALSGRNENVEKSFHNFANIEVDALKNINPMDILTYKYLVITNPQESVEFLASKMTRAKNSGSLRKLAKTDAPRPSLRAKRSSPASVSASNGAKRNDEAVAKKPGKVIKTKK